MTRTLERFFSSRLELSKADHARVRWTPELTAMLKGVIFDLDGVIVDSHPAHIRAWKRLFASLGKNISDGDFAYLLDGHRREQILRHYLGNLSPEELQEYGAMKDRFFGEEVTGLQPIGGLFGFLASLEEAGIRKAVATSAKRQRADILLQRLGIWHQFATVVTSDDLSEDKPDPHIFRLAAKRLRIDPADLLVAEDAVSGIQAAKSAGMRCLAVTQNGHAQLLRNAGADMLIHDFRSVSLADIRMLFRPALQLPSA